MAIKVYEEMKKKKKTNLGKDNYQTSFLNFSINDELVKNNLMSQVDDIQSKLLERKKKSTIKMMNSKVSNLLSNNIKKSKSFSDNEKTILSNNSSKNSKNIKIGDKEFNLVSPDANFLLQDKNDGNISPFSKGKEIYFDISEEMDNDEDMEIEEERK